MDADAVARVTHTHSVGHQLIPGVSKGYYEHKASPESSQVVFLLFFLISKVRDPNITFLLHADAIALYFVPLLETQHSSFFFFSLTRHCPFLFF